MKIECEYCGSFISDTDEKCPNCGGTNSHLMRSAQGIPKTVDELRAFCAGKNMPLRKMRFFIGEDCREARAFGIYQEEDGDFIVYKNKSDGSRAVRYRGKDEVYAVNELYQKLKAEVQQRKAKPRIEKSKPAKPKGCGTLFWIAAVIAVVTLAAIIIAAIETPNQGYYQYGGSYYYNTYDDWYYYDEAKAGWTWTEADGELTGNYKDYWQSYDYSNDYSIEDFSNSEYGRLDDPGSGSSRDDDRADDTDSGSSWAEDWDDSDWDYDYSSSWDSGDSDWDSDW